MSSKATRRKGRKQSSTDILSSLVAKGGSNWDLGATGPANRAGLMIEDATWTDPETGEKKNPNGVKRARRIDMVESYFCRGVLDYRQYTAATALRNTFEATQRSAPAIKKVQVDSSPKPDANVAIMVDRISKYSAIGKHITPRSKRVIELVVIDNQSVGKAKEYRGWNHAKGVRLLQEGLSIIADKIGC